MGSVFAMQGIGQFTAAIIALIVASGFKESLQTAKSVDLCDGVCQLAVDKMWRIIIGFGAVPGCIALYFRLTIPETPRYTFDVARDSEKAVEDVKAYKPDTRVYAHLLKQVGKESSKEDVWVVSANPFDIAGARAAGLNAAFIDQPGKGWIDRLDETSRPTTVALGVEEAVKTIISTINRS